MRPTPAPPVPIGLPSVPDVDFAAGSTEGCDINMGKTGVMPSDYEKWRAEHPLPQHIPELIDGNRRENYCQGSDRLRQLGWS